MRYLMISLLFLMGLALAGCATSRSAKKKRQKKTHKKSFSTSMVRANFSLKGDDLGNHTPIYYQVLSRCKSADCHSPKTMLSFSLEPGPNTVFLSERSLTIHADSEKYHWHRHTWQDIRQTPPVYGEIISVRLKKPQLKHIAESKKVSGILAGIDFKWSHKNRKPIRSLLKKLKNAAK
jgi:hypothetical protein